MKGKRTDLFFKYFIGISLSVLASYFAGGIIGRYQGEDIAARYRNSETKTQLTYTSIKLVGDLSEVIGGFVGASTSLIAIASMMLLVSKGKDIKGGVLIDKAEWLRFKEWQTTEGKDYRTDRELWEEFKTATINKDAVTVGKIENRVMERYGKDGTS